MFLDNRKLTRRTNGQETAHPRGRNLMFNRTKICAALLVAVAANAWAQDAVDTTQRVEITGSAIRRVESEGALPVTVISRDAIDKTGAQSITELIQKLPAMTGGNFQQSSSSVNGNGNGTTT